MQPDDLCQECELPARYMLETGEYVDRFYCLHHALEWLQTTNAELRDYDLWSARAALESMLQEGSAHVLSE